MVNGLAHYTQQWVNRRCRRAFLRGNLAPYYRYYRDSWNRYCKRRYPFEVQEPNIHITFCGPFDA